MRDYSREIAVHLPLIDQLARRRFGDTALAEEGALYVMDRLREDDCRRLQSFSGRSKFSTFLRAVSLRLLEDFSRHRFGRVRPPSWIIDLGGLWMLLFDLLCLQRLNVADAVQTALVWRRDKEAEEIEQSAWTILERVIDCGKHQGREVEYDESEQGRVQAEKSRTPEEQLLADEQQLFFEILLGDAPSAVPDSALMQKIAGFIRLNGEDRLLLQLCFQEEMSVSRAGEVMGLNGNQVHGKLRRLLARIRKGFDDAGVSDELRALLHD